jgi:hypothetical protein
MRRGFWTEPRRTLGADASALSRSTRKQQARSAGLTGLGGPLGQQVVRIDEGVGAVQRPRQPAGVRQFRRDRFAGRAAGVNVIG